MTSLPHSTLDSEIRQDHRQILNELSNLEATSKPNAAQLLHLHSKLGAHQLAEEDTLYACLEFGSLGIIDESKAVHMLVDNLVQSIELSIGDYEDVKPSLTFLSRLLRSHFKREETEMLIWCRGSLDHATQMAMGQLYRSLFDQIMDELVS